jgi:photosystem II stability/assembly factor-like uncharacterized protein
LYGAALRAPTFAWTVGEHGRIFQSNNTAVTWTSRSSGSVQNVRDVSFPNKSTGWAVGQDGLVMKTQNGGGTWTPQVSGAVATLNGIVMLSSTQGFAVGENGAFIKTTNGGTSWQVMLTPTLATLNAIRFAADGLHGAAVGEAGTIVRTTDGGSQWSVQTLGASVTLMGVAYSTSLNVWAVGDDQGVGNIYSSTDGGATWSTVPIQPSLRLTVEGISVGLKGSSPSATGKILVTTDGGVEWKPRVPPEAADYHRVYFAGDSIGWIVGNGGTLLKSTNGGVNWGSLETGVAWDLYAVHFADSLVGWIAGDGGSILKSTDGGGQIVDYTPPPPVETPQQIALLPNYPNPFNPSTHIAYVISKPTEVKIIVYDVLGHKVREFDLGYQAAGRYDGKQYPALEWDGFDQYRNTLPSGVYFYTIVTTELRQSSKMLLVR